MGKSFRLKLSQVVKDLTLHGRVPVAIPAIIQHEMRSSLISRGELEDGSYYGVKGGPGSS